jgi:hypothetical protein
VRENLRGLPSLRRLALLLVVAAAPVASRPTDPPAVRPAPPQPAAPAPAAPSTAAPAAGDGAGNRTTGMVFGQNHLFTVQAPVGWDIEVKGEGASPDAIPTVFYPRGSSFGESSAVLYVNTASRPRQQKLEEFIARDLEGLRKDSPDVKVEKGQPIETADGKRAEVRRLTSDRWGNFESLAFVAEDAVFVTFVLTARTEAAYRGALPAFEDLVRSYRFLTKDVKISR